MEQNLQLNTDIERINYDANDLDNLQLACRDYHAERTNANIMQVTQEHERFPEILRYRKGRSLSSGF